MSVAEARQLDQAVPLRVALTWASFNTYLTSGQEGLDIFERAKINLDENQWCIPELRHIRGELALANKGEGLAVSRRYFHRALELSSR